MPLNSGEKDLTKKLNCFFEIINVLARAAIEIKSKRILEKCLYFQ